MKYSTLIAFMSIFMVVTGMLVLCWRDPFIFIGVGLLLAGYRVTDKNQ